MGRKSRVKQEKRVIQDVFSSILPDYIFKAQTRRCADALMPDIGEIGITPKLIVLSLSKASKATPLYDMEYIVLDIDGWNDYDVRKAWLKKIGQDWADRGKQPCAVFMISEAWLSHQAANQPRQYKVAGDDPNRKEVALVAGNTADRRGVFVACEMTRDAQEQIANVGEPQYNWDLDRTGKLQLYLLDAFWEGYLPQVVSEIKQHRVYH